VKVLFLSEDLGEAGNLLQSIGQERGTTTGRVRRCGWIDIPQLRYSNMINGYTQVALTKLDVLDDFDTIKIVTAYEHDGVAIDSYPSSLVRLNRCKPVFKTVPGWKSQIKDCRTYSSLPQNARTYVELIEELMGCPITCIGVGPGRESIIFKKVKNSKL